MSIISKRSKTVADKVQAGRIYPFDQAVALLKECTAMVKFEEGVDVAIKTGIDAKKIRSGFAWSGFTAARNR
jgi:large subunit ribosomal protein L1